MSPITLGDYLLELSMFAERVKKKAEDISTNDVRMYLSQDDNLKMSTIGKNLSILKSFFHWLSYSRKLDSLKICIIYFYTKGKKSSI
ncbi:site-specific integrase [Filobacillus milosensis]|uniref:site-specific integrase n=1 Tax=Filobacillus milosensis TaxID=94137 RepID=UPI001891163F